MTIFGFSTVIYVEQKRSLSNGWLMFNSACIESEKNPFQPQSASAAIQVEIWFSLSWIHLSMI